MTVVCKLCRISAPIDDKFNLLSFVSPPTDPLAPHFCEIHKEEAKSTLPLSTLHSLWVNIQITSHQHHDRNYHRWEQ